MRRDDDALSQHSSALAFESLADEVLTAEIGDSVLNRSLFVGIALVSVAVFRKMADAEPDEALAVIFCTQFEIADDFTKNVFEMVLVGAHSVRRPQCVWK
jgi:hypothetical protein